MAGSKVATALRGFYLSVLLIKLFEILFSREWIEIQ